MTRTRSARPTTFRLALVVLALALVASPATATPLDRFRNHVANTDIVEGFCADLTVQIVDEYAENILVNRRGDDGLAYFAARVHGTFSVTNLANGKTLTQVYSVLDKDLKVTDNGDGTLTILVLATGGERWYGPDGKLLFRNPGQIRFELTVDHGGTPDDPSDDEVIAESDLVKGSTGRNDTEGRDFCEDVHTFIG